MKKLYCKRCKRSWIYKGKRVKYYTSCPICKSSVRIDKNGR